MTPFSASTATSTSLSLAKGHTLTTAGHVGFVWQVQSGIFILSQSTADGQSLVYLAKPGDIIGLEAHDGATYTFTATALVSAQVKVLNASDPTNKLALMTQGFRQLQRQTTDMMLMRSGPIGKRLTYFLALLAQADPMRVLPLNRRELPTLKEMANIIDSVIETVCRELNSLLPKEKAPAKSKARSWRSQTQRRSVGTEVIALRC